MSAIIQTIRAMRANYEAKLAACPAWDKTQQFYLEAMIRQSHEDEWLHSQSDNQPKQEA